jgi:hypothetical protein
MHAPSPPRITSTQPRASVSRRPCDELTTRALDTVTADEGELGRDAPASAQADEVGAIEVERTHDRRQILDRGEGPRRVRRVAVSAQVVANRSAAEDETLKLAVPHMPLKKTSAEEDDG